MMSVLFLIVGTVMSVIFVVQMNKGSKYDYMIEPLDKNAFPLHEIYGAGLAMQDGKALRLRGKIGDRLRKNTSLIYTSKYSEFYARITWAQILSVSWMFLSIFLLLAGFTYGSFSLFFAVVGVVLAGVFALFFYSELDNKVKKRTEEYEKEFPNAITMLALIVNSGVILREAWRIVAYGNTGALYDIMQKACDDMRNGMSDAEAIYAFCIKSNSDDIKKFASALIQSIEKGGNELPMFLVNQTSELWNSNRQYMLQKGEQAAGALLMPIAIMFAGTMLIVIAAALQSFSL